MPNYNNGKIYFLNNYYNNAYFKHKDSISQ